MSEQSRPDEWEVVNEPVGSGTWRLPVPGGWLYRYSEWDYVNNKYHTPTVVYVPTPHKQGPTTIPGL